MIRPLRFTPAAIADLDALTGDLEAREESLGDRFLESADATLRSIETSPGLGERLRSSRRKLQDIRIRRVENFDNDLILYRPTTRL